ncbi:MAG: hypothetical protein ACI9XP_000173 [Lentimonas sp.]|jgi:hypothetical protein
MKRIHLWEFEDLSWFPKNIRNYMTDFLQHVSHQFDLFKPIKEDLTSALKKMDESQILDLASGGGGPWQKVAKHLGENRKDLKVELSDFYPNHPALERMVSKDPSVFSYSQESINALDVPKEKEGFRTQFLSFHHFKPENAKQIIQNAVDAKKGIAIFEAQERDISHLIKFALSPINVLILTPFIRPFKWGRLLFTYLIPLVPIFVFWDGLVSVLRTYSVKEMEAMAESLKNSDSYDWNIGKHKSMKGTVLYLIGTPKA